MAEQPKQEPRYIVSVRTALSGPESGIMKELPATFLDSTVAEVLKYLTVKKQVSEEELITARSIQSEMSRNYSVAVNGKSAKAEDTVRSLFEPKTHHGAAYQSLEIEVASVQEGGLEYHLG